MKKKIITNKPFADKETRDEIGLRVWGELADDNKEKEIFWPDPNSFQVF